jgi:cation transporter-like permease
VSLGKCCKRELLLRCPIFLLGFGQVGLLLHIANVMVHRMWSLGIDPDNSAIPYLTALGDLMGGILLAIVFVILF